MMAYRIKRKMMKLALVEQELYLDPNEMSGQSYFCTCPQTILFPKRRLGYARCSLTGNKNYPAITKLTNTM